MTISAFEVSVVGKPDWGQIINAATSGQAKYWYHQSLLDAWPDVPWTALRCRRVGEPVTTERFKSTANYRGLPGVLCGQRVTVGTAIGTIVGHNDSANFDVLFDTDSPKYPGLRLNVHPSEMEMVEGLT